MKRFWFYNKQVDRLAAEADLRMINLLGSVTAQEAYGKAIDNLQQQMGEIYVLKPVVKTLEINSEGLDPEFDREGLRALKMKIIAQNRR